MSHYGLSDVFRVAAIALHRDMVIDGLTAITTVGISLGVVNTTYIVKSFSSIFEQVFYRLGYVIIYSRP